MIGQIYSFFTSSAIMGKRFLARLLIFLLFCSELATMSLQTNTEK